MTFLLQSTVFPPENQISPVADQLRQMLATAPWAHVGLGLPVVGSLVFIVTFFGPFTTWYKKWLEPFVWYFTDSLFWLWTCQVPSTSSTSTTASESIVSRHEADIGKCYQQLHCLIQRNLFFLITSKQHSNKYFFPFWKVWGLIKRSAKGWALIIIPISANLSKTHLKSSPG